ncbi:ATP-binding protein, partial [Frederiksenia canicola]
MSNNTPSMKISHNIIEHLGLKLYQNKPTNVIAELVSNAWDANAKNLKINLQDSQRDFRFISIEDDG